MKNIYDIRYEKNLMFILPERTAAFPEKVSAGSHACTAVIIYLYYMDTVDTYYKYIDQIPSDIDLYIISSVEDVLNAVRSHAALSARERITYLLKENRGRDVSALLISSRDIVKNYQYVCFLHDKKEHSEGKKRDIRFWVENLWGNQIGSADYIDGILELFEKHEYLGILSPPEPVGDHFNTWYGFGWCESFDITCNIAEKLGLHADIRQDRPPVTFGTVLWFRTNALRKLFDAEWNYSDFNDRELDCDGYVSYGIERIFSYVAQDAGYDTGTVMTVSYAEKQTAYLQYTTRKLMEESEPFFPVNCLYDLECYQNNKTKILDFVRANKDVYLYGTGKMGRFCLMLLQMHNVLPRGFLVSHDTGISSYGGIPVSTIDKLQELHHAAVIMTVFDDNIQQEMIKNLEGRGCMRYISFWERGQREQKA